MAHNRDAELDDCFDRVRKVAFEFHRFRTRLNERHRRPNPLFDRSPVAAERHIGDQQRALDAAPNRPRVMEHFIERDGHGCRIAEHHVAKRIADKNDVDAGLVDEAREQGVVGRDAHDFSATLHRTYRRRGAFGLVGHNRQFTEVRQALPRRAPSD